MFQKMIMAIIPRQEAENVVEALVSAGYATTFIESRGGFLRQAQYTLYTATESSKVDRVLAVIAEHCYLPADVDLTAVPGTARTSEPLAKLGGAVIFVWDLEQTLTV